MAREYWWVITRDLIEDGRRVGTVGPRGASKTPPDDDLGRTFRMLDDDGEVYYHGTIIGDFEGFEPLDDFGMPNAGCTAIEYMEHRDGRNVWVRL